jgi:hypothetical protein
VRLNRPLSLDRFSLSSISRNWLRARVLHSGRARGPHSVTRHRWCGVWGAGLASNVPRATPSIICRTPVRPAAGTRSSVIRSRVPLPPPRSVATRELRQGSPSKCRGPSCPLNAELISGSSRDERRIISAETLPEDGSCTPDVEVGVHRPISRI